MIFRATVKTQYLLIILAIRRKSQEEQSFKVIEVVRHEQESSSSINQKVLAEDHTGDRCSARLLDF